MEKQMKAFLRSKDPLEWDVVDKGIIPKTTTVSERGKEAVESSDMTQEEITKRQALDAKVIYFILCIVSY